MYCTRKISPDIHWVGGYDRRLALFENMFPIPEGVAYHSYVILDEKVAVLDTVDAAISRQFIENILHVLNGREVDFLVVNHMEPDHCANIEELVRRFPNMKIIGNKKTFQMIEQFYGDGMSDRYYEVKEGDKLSLGKHELQFYFAPLVHWPEVMVTYEATEHILFSADAFGSFGAANGNLFADEIDFGDQEMEQARRYYTNIVGKYGVQVQAALKKLDGLKIEMICPVHGYLWRKKEMALILEKYDLWSRYVPEKKGVLLAYASMYGNTENVINVLANLLAERGIRNLRIFDVSKTHPSYIISDAFAYSHLVLGCPTYNSGLYYSMSSLLHEMEGLLLKNRKVALISNGTWGPAAGKIMKKELESMKNMELISEPFEVKSAMHPEQISVLEQLADQICASVNQD